MKTFKLEDTKLDALKRVVDRDGNWERYFQVPSQTYLDSVTTILGKGYPKGIGFENWLGSKTDAERAEILSEATDRGDIVHRTIDLLISGTESTEFHRRTEVFSKDAGEESFLSNRAWDNMLTFHRFWDLHRPIVVSSELPLFSLAHGYAGTTDAILILTKKCDVKSCPCDPYVGKPGIWDWKSGKNVYSNHLAQVAAYAMADNLPVEPLYAAVLALGSKAILTGGYEMKITTGEDMGEDFARFLAAQKLADIKPFNPAKDMKDVPDSINIVITNEVELEPTN